MKRFLSRGVLALVMAGALAAAGTGLLLILPGPEHVGPVVVAVTHGERFEDIAYDLARANLIRSATVLRLWARASGRDRDVSWGDYVVQPPISPIELLDRLTLPPDPLGRITIPEGLTVADTITLLVEGGHGSRESFDSVLGDAAFLEREGLSSTGTEGYLFPDTYVFPTTMTPEQILHEMVARFRAQFDPTIVSRGRALGLTPQQVVTLASLIEEETTLPEERRQVSAVFHNRLRLGMRMQSDPTVLYGRLDGDRSITRSDLQRPTAHNTYVIPGLPPTPIANPGRGTLEAAVDPAPGDVLYFVARGDGSHEFTASLAAHNAAVARYQR